MDNEWPASLGRKPLTLVYGHDTPKTDPDPELFFIVPRGW